MEGAARFSAVHASTWRSVAKNSSMRKIGIPDEHFSPALVASGEWLDGALRHIDEKYGGLEEYLVERVGVPANELEELRSLLVV